MISKFRWEAECHLVERKFPLFRPFVNPYFLGFEGIMSRHGRIYEVIIQADVAAYPEAFPTLYVWPPIPEHCESGGRACFPEHAGHYRKTSFASQLRMLKEHIEGCARQSS